jgi:hypothetical protein
MIRPLISSFVALRDAAVNVSWIPLVNGARYMCLSVLSKIQVGQIEIRDADGSITLIGEEGESLSGSRCVLNVHKDTFWLRLALYADMVSCDTIFLEIL